MIKNLISMCIVVILLMSHSMAFAWTRNTTVNGNTIYGMVDYPHYFLGYSGFTSETTAAIHNACVTWNNAGAGNLIYRSTQTHNFLPANWDEGNEIWDVEDGTNKIVKKSVGGVSYVGQCHSYAYRQLDLKFKIEESDILLNTWYELGSNGHELIFDVETILLHEFGHAVGLGHSNIGTVMYEEIDRGSINRTLSSDDITGVNAIY